MKRIRYMEQSFEKLLNISTSGNQKNFNEFIHYNRYEPTSYYVLEAILHNYPLLESDNIVDFGSGKGRLNFFLNYFSSVYLKRIPTHHHKSYSRKPIIY